MVSIDNWFILSLLAAFAFSGMILLFRVATDKGVSPILGIFYIVLVAAILLGGYIFAVEKNFMTSTNILIILIIAGIFSFIGNALIFKAVSSAPNPGYPVAVEALRIVLITVISILIFTLKPNPIGIFGTLLVVAGIILLSTVS